MYFWGFQVVGRVPSRISYVSGSIGPICRWGKSIDHVWWVYGMWPCYSVGAVSSLS
jgi:hypothetical protein